MRDQDMQFADPEWHPSRQRRSSREPTLFTPANVNDPPHQQTGGQQAARGEAKETGDPDAPRDYRAEQSGYQSPAQRSHRSHSSWFWVILVAMGSAILSYTPLGDSIRIFWEVVVAVAISAGITALITPASD